MRTYHYAIIFAILAIIFITIRDISFSEVALANDCKSEYEKCFSRAVDSAVEQLSFDENGCIYSSRDAAYSVFLNSMTTSLDLNMDPESRQRLELFLPIVAIADEDGLYIYYYRKIEQDSKILERVWSERIPYEVDYHEIHYEFTLSGKMTWYDNDGNQMVETILTEEFQSLFHETISSTIEENFTQYVNQHNMISKQYGIQYMFHVPSLDHSMSSRAITNPSFLVLFQGYPLHGTEEVYQNFAFAGASIRKNDWYVLTKQDWYYLYHRQDCNKIIQLQEKEDDTEEIICHSKEECAKYGAYPCPDCLDCMGNYTFIQDTKN